MSPSNRALTLTIIAASLLYPTSNALALCSFTGSGPSVAALNDGTTCTVSGSFGTSSGGTAVALKANPGATMIMSGNMFVTSANYYGIQADGAGANISNTANVNVTTSGDDANGIYASNSGLINLNNINIATSGTTYAQGLIAEDNGTINVVGDTIIKTTGSSATEKWKGNEGVASGSGATVTLNTADIRTTGNYSTGIVGFGGTVTASGKTRVDTRGQYADGVLAAAGGNIALSSEASVYAYGANSAAIRLANLANVTPNQVTITNGVLSASQANTIEVNGGVSNVTLSHITTSAASGRLLINVDNGTNLANSGFHDATKIVPNSAMLTLTANDNSVLRGDTVVASDGSKADLIFNSGSLYTGKMTNVTNATFNNGSWNVTGNSNITQNLTNAGGIYFQNLGQTVTVGGNYTGVAGSVIRLDTQLGDDNSPTDKLHVIGNTCKSHSKIEPDDGVK